MRRLLPVVALAALAAASGCSLFGSSTKAYRAADPAPVALTSTLRSAVRIGLVTSANAAPGEGRDVAPLAQGARVAEFRFRAGGAKVSLDVRDDGGTAAGARDAVRSLADDGVVGIVYASQGPHLAAGVTAAQQAGIPVLLPYAGALPAGAAGGAWLTGPSDDQVATVLAHRLATERLRPFLLSVGTSSPGALALSNGASLPAHVVFDSSAVAVPSKAVTSVAVWAGAQDSAAAVERLQAQRVAGPYVLSPAALSPLFSDKLFEDAAATGTASTSARFLTAGLPTDRTSARSVGFAAAAALAASDSRTTSVLNERQQLSSSDARAADGRAHDAVVLLVRAAERAAAPSPTATLAALRALRPDQESGLVGPPLALDRGLAVTTADVQPLQSAVQDGVLVWFALPASS